MTSLFGTVTRFTPTPFRNPREDILTQCFAATINSADQGVGVAIANLWIEAGLRIGLPGQTVPRTATVKARTQQHLPQLLDRVDLVLEVGAAEHRPPSSIWVEVKHHASLSGADQLRKYGAALAALAAADGREHRLVFLPPAGFHLRDDQAPTGLISSDWSQVGRRLSECVLEQDPRRSSTWIVHEFIEFLREEELYMTDPFTDNDLHVLESMNAAQARYGSFLSELHRRVDAWVDAQGWPLGEYQQWPRQPGWPAFWRHFGRHDGLYRGNGWLEWQVQTLEGEYEPSLAVGVTFETAPGDDVWSALEAASFQRRFDDKRWRAFRVQSLRDLTAGAGARDLESQIKAAVQYVQDGLAAAVAVDRSH